MKKFLVVNRNTDVVMKDFNSKKEAQRYVDILLNNEEDEYIQYEIIERDKFYNERHNSLSNIIEIKEDVKIGDVILEKGDRIKVFKESTQIDIDENTALLILNAINMYRKSPKGRSDFSSGEFDFAYKVIEKAV